MLKKTARASSANQATMKEKTLFRLNFDPSWHQFR